MLHSKDHITYITGSRVTRHWQYLTVYESKVFSFSTKDLTHLDTMIASQVTGQRLRRLSKILRHGFASSFAHRMTEATRHVNQVSGRPHMTSGPGDRTSPEKCTTLTSSGASLQQKVNLFRVQFQRRHQWLHANSYVAKESSQGHSDAFCLEQIHPLGTANLHGARTKGLMMINSNMLGFKNSDQYMTNVDKHRTIESACHNMFHFRINLYITHMN